MRLDGPEKEWRGRSMWWGPPTGARCTRGPSPRPCSNLPRMRIAVVENLSRKSEDRQARDLLLQELEGPVSRARLAEIKGELGDVLVSSPGRRGFRVDSTAVERERTLDGRFLLFSTDLALDGPEMYRTYFAKDAVEKAFRTSKGDLSLGPVALPAKGSVGRLRHGRLCGLSALELGGAEIAGEIPRASPLGDAPRPRERLVGTVWGREIGPGMVHPSHQGAEGTPRHLGASEYLPATWNPLEGRSESGRTRNIGRGSSPPPGKYSR